MGVEFWGDASQPTDRAYGTGELQAWALKTGDELGGEDAHFVSCLGGYGFYQGRVWVQGSETFDVGVEVESGGIVRCW